MRRFQLPTPRHKVLYMNDSEEFHKLIATWIKLYEVADDSPERDALFWSFMKLDEWVRVKPDLAWQAILEIVKARPSAEVLSNLAAGPLEDLLCRHGESFIARIEQEAERSVEFKRLLAGVWRRRMDQSVWDRVERIRR